MLQFASWRALACDPPPRSLPRLRGLDASTLQHPCAVPLEPVQREVPPLAGNLIELARVPRVEPQRALSSAISFLRLHQTRQHRLSLSFSGSSGSSRTSGCAASGRPRHVIEKVEDLEVLGGRLLRRAGASSGAAPAWPCRGPGDFEDVRIVAHQAQRHARRALHVLRRDVQHARGLAGLGHVVVQQLVHLHDRHAPGAVKDEVGARLAAARHVAAEQKSTRASRSNW